MNAVWIDANNNAHQIEGDNIEDIQNKIAELREALGQEEPDLMTMTPGDELSTLDEIKVRADDLDEETKKEIAEQVKSSIRNARYPSYNN